MKLTRNPYRLVGATMILQSGISLICIGIWAPLGALGRLASPSIGFQFLGILILLSGTLQEKHQTASTHNG